MRIRKPSRLLSALAGLGLSAWLLLPGPLNAQSVQDQLPEMGTAAQATLSLESLHGGGTHVRLTISPPKKDIQNGTAADSSG